MLTNELLEKLKETIAIGSIHHERMRTAYKQLNHYFPLNEENYSQISAVDLAFFDQLIYRFSKLQDIMGTRLFIQLLELLEEDVEGIPFIDILNKLEKLRLLDSAKEWIALRQTRNAVSHEYPFYKEIQLEELNLLSGDVLKLSRIWTTLTDYVKQRLR